MILIATIILSCIAALKLLLALITFFIARNESLENRKALTLIRLNTPNCFWYLAKQPDGSYISQINIQVDVANTTARPIGLSKVELRKPKKQKVIDSRILLPSPVQSKSGSRVHGSEYKISANDTVTASISIVTQGTIAPLGRTLPVTIGITDQFGILYLLEVDLTPTPDQVLP